LTPGDASGSYSIKESSVSAPDLPITDPKEDFFGRGPLSKVIYELIKNTPVEFPVRIGIYGGWGEGKTSLMRLISELARQDGLPVSWFTAWPATDSKQLWLQFVKDLDAVTENRDRGVWLKRKLSRTIDATRGLADAHAAAKAGHALAQLAGEALSVDAGDARRVLSRLAAHQRIVVMIDDLDRVDPSLLPTLFMGLHDIFENVGRCAFVMGLDPMVVSNGLGGVNSAWGSAPAFLEKIVQYPFWLRSPTRPQQREFARTAAKQWNLGSLQLPVDDLLDLLPTNPRQLKQFFRSLSRLKSVVMRHDPDELNATLLVGIELLRLTDRDSAERLLASATFENQLRAVSI
jgi:KAP family P-loop domain